MMIHINFDDLYGTLIIEKHRPSLKDQSLGMPFNPSGQIAANIGKLILCSKCLQPQIMYSQHKFKPHDNVVLESDVRLITTPLV